MKSFLPGKQLPEKVIAQIEKRQEVLGLTGDRFSENSSQSYAYYQQKAPWIRLVSSIDKDGDSTLAKANILSNGILEGHNKNTPAGYEISPTLGPRPKPGITSMDLKTHNRFGSLRTATINFVVFSVEDLNTYERLYMSPGYTALLEWGHSKALDSKTGEVSDVVPLSFEDVFEGDTSMTKVFETIKDRRVRYNYNYDGMFGFVKNFSWSLNTDGSYACSTDIVSIGTAFESMNISAGVLPKDVLKYLEDNPSTKEESEIVSQEYEGTPIISAIDELLFGPSGDKIILPGKQPGEVVDQISIAQAYKNLLNSEIEVNIADNSEDLILKNGKYPGVGVRELFKSTLDIQTGKVESLRVRDASEPDSVKDVIIAASPDNLSFIIARSYRRQRLEYTVEQKEPPSKGTRKFFKPVSDKVNPPTNLKDIVPEYIKGTNNEPKILTLPDNQVVKINTPSEEDIIQITGIDTDPYDINQSTRSPYDIYLIKVNVTVEQVEEELPADTQEQKVNQENLNQILNTIRKYYPELRSRVHFFINQLLMEVRNNVASFTESSTSDPSNFYREFESSYLLNKLRNLLYPNNPEARTTLAQYSTTASKYITIDQIGAASATESTPENRPDLNYQYIQFGAFLEILNLFILRDQNKVPIFTFDTSTQTVNGKVVRDFRTLDNFHCSVDVSKCLLPRTEKPQNLSTKRPVDAITGILLEKQYLYGVLNSNMVKGELKFYDLVQTILDDISRVTGKVNDLQLQYYENSRTFRILDRNFIEVDEEYPSISIFGKNNFTKQVHLASRLTPEISTQLAIAAQAEPNSNAIEGSAWGSFNKGLIDRIVKQKKDEESLARDESEIDNELERIQKQFASVFQYLLIVYGQDESRPDVGTFAEAVQKLGLVPPNVISDYVDFCAVQLKDEVTSRNKVNNFIIPYELNLTVDGISGLEVMSAFITDDTLIPERYKGNGGIGFLITGLQHKVTPQGWDTSINSQIFNLDRGKRKSNEGEFKLLESSDINTNSISSTSDTLYNPVVSKIPTYTQQQAFARKVNEALPSESESIKAGVVFLARQEQNFQGYNYNYYGVMADIAKWTGGDTFFNGSFKSTEGSAGQGVRTKKDRYFASFGSEENGIRFIANQLKRKGWDAVTENNIAATYYKTWLSPENPESLIKEDGGKKGELWASVIDSIRTNLT